ncbi:shikimate kinase [uncultured Ruthenibacterium sp.]|uniref:shikimate kinase n=1 Tax=uncultured Ruthenibacterium sp. TaxID=1905347 RepID=UPI00349EFBEF
MEYGLIGKKLGHSFSKPIHEALAGYSYELFPLPDEDAVRAFFAQRSFKAVNVTIPYKQLALALCDEVDEKAASIGAVNTVVNRGGRLYGYNTDYAGFLYMTKRAGIDFANRTVLLLGTGGTSRTVSAVVRDEGAKEVLFASRSGRDGALRYDQAMQRKDVDVVVNVSPAGMYPDNGTCLVDLGAFPNLAAVADVVYNPAQTALLCQAQRLGVRAAGGLPMLVAQAKYAAEYFSDKKIPDEKIEPILKELRAKQMNLVLIGMPSCGKSSLGKACAKLLGKRFVDLDAEIEREEGRPIPEILAPGNETYFRDVESRVTAHLAKESGQVLSTGGGVVLRKENVDALRQNGVVVYIDRPLQDLRPGGNRPLSQSTQALAAQYAVRAPLYEQACHATVKNDAPFYTVADRIKERFYEVLDRERPEH